MSLECRGTSKFLFALGTVEASFILVLGKKGQFGDKFFRIVQNCSELRTYRNMRAVVDIPQECSCNPTKFNLVLQSTGTECRGEIANLKEKKRIYLWQRLLS